MIIPVWTLYAIVTIFFVIGFTLAYVIFSKKEDSVNENLTDEELQALFDFHNARNT